MSAADVSKGVKVHSAPWTEMDGVIVERRDVVLYSHYETLSHRCEELERANAELRTQLTEACELLAIKTTRLHQIADERDDLSAAAATLRAELDEELLNGDAIDAIRKACAEIMGGNCAFVDDDFARCLLTLRDENATLRAECERLRERVYDHSTPEAVIRCRNAELLDERQRHIDTITTLRARVGEMEKARHALLSGFDALMLEAANDRALANGRERYIQRAQRTEAEAALLRALASSEPQR